MCKVIIQANAVLEGKHHVFTVHNRSGFLIYLHIFSHVELCGTKCREFGYSACRRYDGSFHWVLFISMKFGAFQEVSVLMLAG